MKKFIGLVLLLASTAFAQQIPETTAQQQKLQNLVINAGFENGPASVVTSGGTFLVGTSNKLFGKNSAAFTPSATAQYFESAPVVIPEGLYGETCQVAIKYKGSSSSVYLTLMDSASTELIPTTSRATLNNTTGTKQAKIYFTCPSSGSLKYRVQSTASGAIGYFDNAEIGLSDAVFSKQAQFLGDVTYTVSGNIAFTFATFSDISVSTTSTFQNLTSPTGSRIGFKIPNAAKGRYKIIASGFGLFNTTTTNSGGQVSFASSDIATATSCGLLTAQGNVAASTDGRSAASFICEYDNTTDQTNKEFWLKAQRTVNGATLEWGVGAKLSVYFYPSGTDTVVNSKCANDISCESNFSMSITNSGTGANTENLDWINGNCSYGASRWTCTFNTSVFSVAPICTATPFFTVSNSAVAAIDSVSTTQVVINTVNNAVNVQSAFNLYCQRASSDFKAKQTIQGFLASTVTSTANNERTERLLVSAQCTASPCTITTQSGAFTSVTRASTGVYTAVIPSGTFSAIPSCFAMAQTQVGNPAYIVSSGTNTTLTGFTFGIKRSDTHAFDDNGFSVMCIGAR